MYFGRLEANKNKTKTPLPHEWLEEFTKTLNDVYAEQRVKQERFFDIYGEIYDDEFVVVVSFIHNTDLMTSPISLFLAHDNEEDSKKFKKTLDSLINLTGLIFDDIFAVDDWNDYVSVWTENNYKDSHFHYKITRENISLTIQAEALLNKDIEL